MFDALDMLWCFIAGLVVGGGAVGWVISREIGLLFEAFMKKEK
ncbi:MAG: hypothetical protein V4508_02195 [Pseudomonadota bacterium]